MIEVQYHVKLLDQYNLIEDRIRMFDEMSDVRRFLQTCNNHPREIMLGLPTIMETSFYDKV